MSSVGISVSNLTAYMTLTWRHCCSCQRLGNTSHFPSSLAFVLGLSMAGMMRVSSDHGLGHHLLACLGQMRSLYRHGACTLHSTVIGTLHQMDFQTAGLQGRALQDTGFVGVFFADVEVCLDQFAESFTYGRVWTLLAEATRWWWFIYLFIYLVLNPKSPQIHLGILQ